jgi:heme/copper-type cytochrome/quinol oxidase subunit 1
MTHDIAVNGLFIFIFVILVFNALAFIGSGIGLVFGFAAVVMAWFGFAADPLRMGLLLAGGIIGPVLVLGAIAWLKLDKMQRHEAEIDKKVWDEWNRQTIASLYNR